MEKVNLNRGAGELLRPRPQVLSWKVKRQSVEKLDGQRRWNQTYLNLVNWTAQKPAVRSAAGLNLTAGGLTEQVCQEG